MSFLRRGRLRSRTEKIASQEVPATAKQLKILLTGIAGSGKSTLLKRFMLLKKGPEALTNKQDGMRNYTIKDLLGSTAAVLDTLGSSPNRPKEDVEFEDAVELIEALMSGSGIRQNAQPDGEQRLHAWLDDDAVDALKYLWSLPNFHSAIAQTKAQGRLYVSRNYEYLMTKLVANYPTWGGKGSKFDVEDFLQVSVRTNGLVAGTVNHRDYELQILDVGGRRGERKKLIHLFENLDALVFTVAANQYDETIAEHDNKSSLLYSLELLEFFMTHRDLTSVKVVLVLTHLDLFREKFSVEKVPLDTFGLLPDAPNNTDDVPGALKCIANLFLSRLTNAGRQVSVHYIDSLSSADMCFEDLLDDFTVAER